LGTFAHASGCIRLLTRTRSLVLLSVSGSAWRSVGRVGLSSRDGLCSCFWVHNGAVCLRWCALRFLCLLESLLYDGLLLGFILGKNRYQVGGHRSTQFKVQCKLLQIVQFHSFVLPRNHSLSLRHAQLLCSRELFERVQKVMFYSGGRVMWTTTCLACRYTSCIRLQCVAKLL
jgi:hypothetical protein